MRGDLARSHAKAVRGSAQELMHKWPCMVGATALERLQTHSFVILVHVKLIVPGVHGAHGRAVLLHVVVARTSG